MKNKKLLEFKEEIREEYSRYYTKGIKGPILNRLQIHLDSIGNKDYKLSNYIDNGKMDHELYVGMIYDLFHLAKKKSIFNIIYEGQAIEGKNDREKIQNLTIKIGADNIKKLKSHSRFLYKKDIGEVVGNAYKVIDENHSFDTSFGGVGTSPAGKYFVKELKSTLKLNIEFTYEETFSYS